MQLLTLEQVLKLHQRVIEHQAAKWGFVIKRAWNPHWHSLA